MNKLTQLIILIFILAISFWGCFVFFAQADIKDIAGFAWSENTGWLSFNSSNCDSDGDGITDTGNFPQCPLGISISSYGVNIDLDSGDLSGNAWSENIGWVSFNRVYTGNPPSNPYQSGSGAIAKYDVNTEELTGWMRVLACCSSIPCTSDGPCSNCGGWDGWIRFCDTGLANCSGADQIAKIDSGTGQWHGWAWSDSKVGWLSFNSSDPGAGDGYDYGVAVPGGINQAPTVANLTVVKLDYGSTPGHYFSWIYSDPDGDNEIQFQFQVDDSSDFSSPEVDRAIPGTWADGDSNSQTVIVAVTPGPDQIGYDTIYYWRVKVWDSQGRNSGWIDYDEPTDPDGDGNSSTFTTEFHRYPSADFTWSPQNPSQDENVQFDASASTCYDINDNPTTCASWSWIFTNGNPPAVCCSIWNPIIQFTSDGSKQVTLTITDADGLTGQVSKTVGIQVPLPGWEEILPQP